MTTKRIYWVMIGVDVILACGILGSVVLGDKMLKKQSDVIISKKLENAVLENEQSALKQAKVDLEKYTELKQIAKQIVPQEKDQALTTREIIIMAESAGVNIGSIGFPSSNLGSAAKKPADSTAASAPSAISQAKPVTGIKDLLELQIVVTSDTNKPSTYNQLISFLSKLENNRRTAQVSQISIQPDAKNTSSLNFSLTLTLYIKP